MFAKHYRGQTYFHVMESEDVVRIEPELLNGTNDIEIHVFMNEARRQALLVAKFDNLGKGASGAAVQNLITALATRSPTELTPIPSMAPVSRPRASMRSSPTPGTGATASLT